MGRLLDKLKAAAGEAGLMNALGRWRQAVSQKLDGGEVFITGEVVSLTADVDVLVGDPAVTLALSTTLTNATERLQEAFIDFSAAAVIGAGDTSATLGLTLEESVDGGAFAVIASVGIGVLSVQDQFSSAELHDLRPFQPGTIQWRLRAIATGTATDVVSIHAATEPRAYAQLKTQVFYRP